MRIKRNVIIILAAAAVLILTTLSIYQLREKNFFHLLGLNRTSLSVSNDYPVSALSTTVQINSNSLVPTSTSGALNVAELVFTYPSSEVRLTAMVEGANLLSLNKTIDNGVGKATIDLGYPQTNFPTNTTLLTLQFEFLQAKNSVVNIAAASTLGSPNVLNYAASTTSYPLTYPQATSSATSSASSSTSSSNSTAGSVTPIPIFRFYKPKTLGHIYTTSVRERDKIIRLYSADYIYEGQRGYVLPRSETISSPSEVQVHRFYNFRSGTHRYTSDLDLINSLKSRTSTFQYEGIVFHAYGVADISTLETDLPFYEFANTVTGGYFYTSSEREKNKVIAQIPQLRYVGVSFRVLK